MNSDEDKIPTTSESEQASEGMHYPVDDKLEEADQEVAPQQNTVRAWRRGKHKQGIWSVIVQPRKHN